MEITWVVEKGDPPTPPPFRCAPLSAGLHPPTSTAKLTHPIRLAHSLPPAPLKFSPRFARRSARRSICNQLSIQSYDENTGNGDLKYVQISVETKSEKVQLTLVWNATGEKENERKSELDILTKTVVKEMSSSLHSLYVHYNRTWKHANNIFGREKNSWVSVFGPKAIEETMVIER